MPSPTLFSELQHALAGSYALKRELGGGGMARVFLAEETALGRPVVVKVLPPDLSAGVSVGRFRREIQVAAQLRHPHIVPVLSAGQTGGFLYYTMPFVEGESLRARIVREQRLGVTAAITLAKETADALDYAHRQGVVHRDIKPENILLESGHAQVADFGIARAVSEAADARTLTATGIILGTPYYMSPEQAFGEVHDGRADIYSLGCVLFEMLAGRPPYTGPGQVVLTKHCVAPVPRLAEVGIDAPEWIEAVLARAMAKAPDERFVSAGEMRDALAEGQAAWASGGFVTPPALRSAATRSGATWTPLPQRTASGPRRTSAVWSVIDSVAVMPFENAGGSAETEYLSDGVTENIINRLAKLPRLRVVPRSTVFRYKNKDIELLDVATQLNVRAVVTGRVYTFGDRLVVKAELTDVTRDRQLWGEEYQRLKADVLAVQDEMAEEISRALRVQLSAEDRRILKKRYTDDPVAYDLYLRGRFHWAKRNHAAFTAALEFFGQAIAQDPTYALAYAGLSDTWNVFGYYNFVPPREAYPRAKEASARALALDEGLAEAHASSGYTQLFFDRDWAGAERSFQRAIELDSGYASAHQWYGWSLLVAHRFDETVTELREAQRLDPLSLIINDHLAYAYQLVGDDEAALRQVRKTQELDPTWPLSYLRLGTVHFGRGRFTEAVDAFERARTLSDGRIGLGYLGQAYAAAGRPDEARATLATLDATARERYVSPLDRALVLSGLGDLDATFAALGQAEEDCVSDLARVTLLPWPDAVIADARFGGFVRRLGLP